MLFMCTPILSIPVICFDPRFVSQFLSLMFITQQSFSWGRFFHEQCAATLYRFASCMHPLVHVQSPARMHLASMLAIEKKGVIAPHAEAPHFDTSQPGHCLWSMLGRTTGVVDIFIVLTLYG